MTTVHLGFRAFDMHELACHFVARHAGFYATEGIEVRLFDANFVAAEKLPPRTFLAACTAALIDWLHGLPMAVVFVACERPMFWLVGRRGPGSMQPLAGGRIAGYPPNSAPALLLQRALEDGGLEGTPEILPVRDDQARLGLLVAGEVDAAVISSAVLPSHVARRGFGTLLFFGDALRLPTTGLALHREFYSREPELVRAMCRCHGESLRLLRAGDGLARDALARFLDCTMKAAGEALDLLHRCYTADGRCPHDVQARAIDSMRRVLGNGRSPPGAVLYDFSALAHNAGEGTHHER